jgi:SAM-dependent methyltransferase
MIVPPEKPSFGVYLRLCRSRRSLLRFYQERTIKGQPLKGTVLDVGGVPGSKKEYKHLFTGWDQWLYLNVNSDYGPDYVCDCNRPLPFADMSFDNVVCMNTLEHIRDITLAVREIVRVIRPGRNIVLSVPFVFNIHGDPYDYHRPTAQWYEEILAELGIESKNICIYPLGWDYLSSALSLCDNVLRLGRYILRPFMLLPGLLSSVFWHMGGGGGVMKNVPLGYKIIAKK